MATYKGIQGYTVQKLSSDPTASEVVGQLWYNSTTGAFKIGTEAGGARPGKAGRVLLGRIGLGRNLARAGRDRAWQSHRGGSGSTATGRRRAAV